MKFGRLINEENNSKIGETSRNDVIENNWTV